MHPLKFRQAISRKLYSDRCFPYLLISPTVLLWLVFMVYPLTYVINLSFQHFNYSKMYMNGFAGLDNFITLFTKDKHFWGAALNSAKWVFYVTAFQFLFGFAIALIGNAKFAGRGVFRSVIFLPWAISGVLTTMLWILMYNQHIGIINFLFKAAGIIEQNVAWLSQESTVFGAVVIAEVWRGTPYFAISLLASLQSISTDIYEAARVDGCGRIRSFVYLTLPFMKETIVLTTLLRAIWSFNSFDMIFTMTNGGPYRLTTTIPIYIFQKAIVGGDMGYGSALSVISFLFLLAFTIFYMKISRYGGNINE